MTKYLQSFSGQVMGGLFCILLMIAFSIYQIAPLLDDRDTGVAGIASGQNDFKHLYLGAVLLNSGRNPYDSQIMLIVAGDYRRAVDARFRTVNPYVYLPFTGLVLTPLTWLDFSESVVWFQWINHLLIFASLFLIIRWSNWAYGTWPFAVGLALVAFNDALFRQNNAGQLNVVLLFGYSVLYVLLKLRVPYWLAGLPSAFLALFKLSPGIVLIWYLARGQWRDFRTSILWMAGFLFLSIVLYGAKIHAAFFPVLANMGFGKSTWAEYGSTFWRDPYNQSINAMLHRWLVPREGKPEVPFLELSPWVANGLTWVFALSLLAGFVYLVYRYRQKEMLPESFSLAIAVSLLLPSLMWDHYLVQLILPLMLLFPRVTAGANILLVTAAFILCLPLNFEQPFYREGFGLLAGSVKLLPPLIVASVAGTRLAMLGEEPAETSPE